PEPQRSKTWSPPTHSRGSSFSTIRAPRVCSNVGSLKIFKVTPKYQSRRRVDMLLRVNQEIHQKIGDKVQRKKTVN
ncbi:hypothetical protein GIB67_008114, partial [Kingdonia uniflora]